MEKRSLPSTLENSRVILRKHSADLAYQMFQEINQDRDRLRQFLPWVDAMKSVDDQIWYINECIKDWAEGTMFDYGIFDFEGNYLGNIGVHSLAWEHDRGELGYWISPRFEGKGFISSAVQLLEKTLFEAGFNRIEIRCDPLNKKSAAVPLRNGYKFEGILRQYQFQGGKHWDTAVHAKLISEGS